MNLSTGAANAIWSTGLATALTDGVIDLLSGPMPTDPDNAQSGTLLCRITKASGAWTAGVSTNGLEYSTPAAGAIGIKGGWVFSGVGLAAGTVGYARIKGNAADDNNATTTLVRIDLTATAGGGGNLNLSSLTVAVGATITVDAVTLTAPRS
jgi:hypothetical protein